MAFVGAYLTPHSPLLLPTIGKEYSRQIKRTERAFMTMAHELHALNPSVLIVIHPHGPTIEGAFSVNVSDAFTANFSEFGDLVTTATWRGAVALSHGVKEHAEDDGFPLTLVHEPTVPYDVGVPLVKLTERLTDVAVLPIGPSTVGPQAHLHFGRMLAEVVHAVPDRIAVIVSAELSHHASAAAAGGMRPEGERFDALVAKSLGKKHWDDFLLSIDNAVVDGAESCGYLPLLMLAGFVKRHNVGVKKLSYEAPFGIGLLTATVYGA